VKRVVALLAVLALLLVGCADDRTQGEIPASDNSQSTGLGQVEVVEVPLPSGYTVTCVLYDGYSGGGITCDWLRLP
jgi:hypothetical protein